MQLLWNEIQKKAAAFTKRWEGVHNEEALVKEFVLDFLKVFGIEDPEPAGRFEHKVKMPDGFGKIDYLWCGKIAFMMKSRGKDLDEAYKQLKNCILYLPEEEIPDLWLVCDFENIHLWRRSIKKDWSFKTAALGRHIKKFAGIAGYSIGRKRDDQVEVNVKAAEKMARLHDVLKAHGYTGHALEVYLVRLLFCMFAEDTGIFPKDSFYNYIERSNVNGSDLSERLARLFEVLDLPEEARAEHTVLTEEYRYFQYIGGKLFSDNLPLAEFNTEIRNILLDCAKFNWDKISPAVFGAMFQGVMDKEQRRNLGAHYTSEENILKLINPLFMDDLWREFEQKKANHTALKEFHVKISSLKFLDPACGCGNFLIIAYRELRLLELEILKMLSGSHDRKVHISFWTRVSIKQFYGIEYVDFPCQIARAGMWLMDHKMNLLVSEQFGQYLARFPLRQSAAVIQGSALRINWEDIVPKSELSYIFGNPPFAGRRYRTQDQISDVKQYFIYKDVDYAACWYIKAAKYIQGTYIKCAFVSTSSICQGEQASPIWKPMFEKYGIHINFGIPAFKWTNEARGKAAVHCIIAGFSLIESKNDLNHYLLKAPIVFIDARNTPLCKVPVMKNGNVPLDGDALKIEPEDIEKFSNCKFLKRLLGGEELLNNKRRFVLWLVGANPEELSRMPLIMERVELCKKLRLSMKDQGTRKLAAAPEIFRDINNPGKYIALPTVSSEKRRYIPMAFFDGETIPTNQVQTIPDAELYHFGILSSSTHMAWVRVICGRLKSDYRYSKEIVYNNFPWPDADDKQISGIEKLAQAVLDARAMFADFSLADLYDPPAMPPELLKAHLNLDRAVMKLYRFYGDKTDEASIAASLMKRYQEIVKKIEGDDIF
jgi:hypothetical protein